MSKQKVVFSISQQHIADGIRGDAERCPGALAILERVATDVSVYLTKDSVSFFYQPTNKTSANVAVGPYEQKLPWELLEFVHCFDCWYKVAPVEFVLYVPNWASSPEKTPSFRLSRTQVTVAAINRNRGWIEVVVPKWHEAEKIRLKKPNLPRNVFHAATPEKRFRAWVNTDINSKAALRFADWEAGW